MTLAARPNGEPCVFFTQFLDRNSFFESRRSRILVMRSRLEVCP